MTGQSAHRNGMLGLAHRGFRLNDYNETLVQFLKSHGWSTHLSGVQHIAKPPAAQVEEIGYDEILCESDTDSVGITEAAENFLARQHDQPFFLDVGFFPPHRIGEGDFPTELPVPNDQYVRPPAHIPDNATTRKDFAAYMSSVSTFDQMLGRVIAAIDNNGLAEETLIIATTDHGIAFPGMKCRLTDHGLGVMLMLRGPGGFEGGKVSDAMTTHLDLFPTVCEVLNLAAPAKLEGRSLCALAEDPEQQLHEAIFAEVNVHAAYEPMRCVRTERWKYIRHFEPRDFVVLANCDNGDSKAYLCDHEWATHPPAKEELYDLFLDPMEGCNLVGEAEYAERLNAMRQSLTDWMGSTDDPLLQGALDLTGKVVTDAKAYSPSGAPRRR